MGNGNLADTTAATVSGESNQWLLGLVGNV